MKLQLCNIYKKFDNKEVLKDISFTFEKGKIYGLLGRNGAGKTTLFNCINSDLKPENGDIMIEKEGIIEKLSPNDIGYVLSTPIVPEFLTGREFLKFFIDVNKDSIKDIKTIDEYFDLVKFKEEDKDRIIKEYSHGMKNKMQILVNLILEPAIILLDEPLTSFDVVVADEMKQFLKNIKKDHIIIFSTHIMELALDLCDEIVILHQGILQEVDKGQLDNEDFKEKIISVLKDEEND